MARFSRSNLPAARTFVDSVVSGGGVGRPRKHPATWSDDYLIRVANAWQRQAARGEPVSLQAARRGPVTFARPGRGEHPRQRHVGGGETRHHGTREGFEVREYRSLPALRRWIETRIPGYPAAPVQIVANGIPTEGYDAAFDRAHRQQAANANYGATNLLAPDLSPVWRILYTGPGANVDWSMIREGRHYPDGRRLFDRIIGYEVRWGDAIEDSPVLYPDR